MSHLILLQIRLCLGSKGLLRFSLGRNIRLSKKFLLFGLEVIFAVRSATLLRKLLRNILKTNILEGGVTAASPIPTPKGVGTGERGQILSSWIEFVEQLRLAIEISRLTRSLYTALDSLVYYRLPNYSTRICTSERTVASTKMMGLFEARNYWGNCWWNVCQKDWEPHRRYSLWTLSMDTSTTS